jgi:glycosyltransferase involved in cell wall biosynthesis
MRTSPEVTRGGVDVSVISTAHDVADARLHRVTAALLDVGLTVEVIALGDPAGAPAGVRVTTMPRTGLLTRALRSLTVPVRAKGRVLFTVDPDPVPVAYVVCRLTGRRLVVDVHEDFRALLSDRRWARGVTGWLARRVAALSSAMAGRADLTVVADSHVPPLRARHRMVVRNVPDRRQLLSGGRLDPNPRAVYVGDVRESRGLYTMLAAIEGAPDWRLDIIGPVAPSDEVRVERWRQTSGAAERVALHGRMPPARAWALAVGAWCGFALLDDTPAFLEAVPSKLYEYLTVGIPALVTPLPRMVAIVGESGGGAVVASVDEVIGRLTAWAADRPAVEKMSRCGVQWAAHTLPDSQYHLLATAVRSLVGGLP